MTLRQIVIAILISIVIGSLIGLITGYAGLSKGTSLVIISVSAMLVVFFYVRKINSSKK